MKKFETGKSYTYGFIGDSSIVVTLTITKRTKCFVSWEDDRGEKGRSKIQTYNNAYESFMPNGSYSMAPVCGADKEVVAPTPKQEASAPVEAVPAVAVAPVEEAPVEGPLVDVLDHLFGGIEVVKPVDLGTEAKVVSMVATKPAPLSAMEEARLRMEYALQDATTLTNEGFLFITDTLHGGLSGEYVDGMYHLFGDKGFKATTNHLQTLIAILQTVYIVEAV